jgi:hypothetical protein
LPASSLSTSPKSAVSLEAEEHAFLLRLFFDFGWTVRFPGRFLATAVVSDPLSFLCWSRVILLLLPEWALLSPSSSNPLSWSFRRLDRDYKQQDLQNCNYYLNHTSQKVGETSIKQNQYSFKRSCVTISGLRLCTILIDVVINS